MVVNFHIQYATKWGENIAIHIKENQEERTVYFQTYDGLNWHAHVELAESQLFEYKYILRKGDTEEAEFGEYRQLDLPKSKAQIFVQDYWRATNWPEQAFFSAAFKDVIFKRGKAKAATRPKRNSNNKIQFRLNAAALNSHQVFGIVGSTEALGDWKKPVVLNETSFPIWSTAIEADSMLVSCEYKYVIIDKDSGQIIEWEEGENRKLDFNMPSEKGNLLIRNDERFRYSSGMWRGAGVAIPVFSLRSKKGLGIGEYTDLKLMVDWAAQTNMKVVQVLPVNDTIGTKTWKDSYPYRAISVFALHPMFVNIDAIAKFKNKKDSDKLNKLKKELNKNETVDFEAVMEAKMEFFQILFEQEKTAFLKNKEVKEFIAENKEWLEAYATFCFLRDKNNSVNFNEWGKESIYSEAIVKKICNPRAKSFHEIAFHYFIQYHAHQQLFAATEYARKNGVILKGDLPIGIGRHSCDAWVAPELYNMNGQAGAPPDFYSENGQNWGFPTYNWEEMAKDDFAWWRKRMQKLAEYFDALRIDHILGFFRIWQIPTDQVIGTMGIFNPRLPYSRNDLRNFGLHGDLSRYTTPYIRGHYLGEIFGGETDFVREEFLEAIEYGAFRLKEFVDNQLKIKNLFSSDKKYENKGHIADGLMKLVSEVLLLEEPGSEGQAFNPRITLEMTRSFKELNGQEKGIFQSLYNDYHFNRHEQYWKNLALWKLPPLLEATNMLICGEDLGMIPSTVPEVMEKLNILTLEIQRMSKGNTAFGIASEYPYTSVASPSCHDMSTVRGWWEEDYSRSEKFFSENTGFHQTAPLECTPGIVEIINYQHLESPSMWAIFPLQDLVGMDERLRRQKAEDEQINQPSNPEHYWRFRFHLPMEDMLKEDELNKKIAAMVAESGRV